MKIKCLVYKNNIFEEEKYLEIKNTVNEDIRSEYPHSISWALNEITDDLCPIYRVNI